MSSGCRLNRAVGRLSLPAGVNRAATGVNRRQPHLQHARTTCVRIRWQSDMRIPRGRHVPASLSGEPGNHDNRLPENHGNRSRLTECVMAHTGRGHTADIGTPVASYSESGVCNPDPVNTNSLSGIRIPDRADAGEVCVDCVCRVWWGGVQWPNSVIRYTSGH